MAREFVQQFLISHSIWQGQRLSPPPGNALAGRFQMVFADGMAEHNGAVHERMFFLGGRPTAFLPPINNR